MRRAFKIPTVRDEDFFSKKVECYARSLKDWEFMRYHIISMEVHQTFCLPCITGRPMDNFVKVNMN